MRIVIVGGRHRGAGGGAGAEAGGVRARVYERAPALLEVGAAIAVWPNAFRVLERLGLGETVLGRAGRMRSVRWLGRDGHPYNQFTFPETGAPAVALHRADLQGALLRALPAESVHLGKTFEGFEVEGEEVRARFREGTEVGCDVLVGADGLHSRVRAQLLGDGEPSTAATPSGAASRGSNTRRFRRGRRRRFTARVSASASGPSGSAARAGGRPRTSRRRRRSLPPSTRRSCCDCSTAGARRCVS